MQRYIFLLFAERTSEPTLVTSLWGRRCRLKRETTYRERLRKRGMLERPGREMNTGRKSRSGLLRHGRRSSAATRQAGTGMDSGGYLSMRLFTFQRPSITLRIHHKLSCPVLPPSPPRALTSIQFSTLLSEHTTRKLVKISRHTLWRPSFSHAIPPMRYSLFFEDKYLLSTNQQIATKGLQNVSFQLSTSCMRFPPLLARVLVW